MARRATAESVLPTIPHIAEKIYSENGQLLGYIADNFVVETEDAAKKILDGVGKMRGESCARKARERC